MQLGSDGPCIVPNSPMFRALISSSRLVSRRSVKGMFELLLKVRMTHYLHGRIDTFAMWKILEVLSFMPWGLTEPEIRHLIGGSNDGKAPYMVVREVLDALYPFLKIFEMDKQITYKLSSSMFEDAVHQIRGLTGETDGLVATADMLLMMKQADEFNQGGVLDERRLRMMPLLLEQSGQMDDFEDHITDLQNIEMSLSGGQYFHLQQHLTKSAPGKGGRVEDSMAFLEEFSKLLHERPRIVLQLALNMPNHSYVQHQGRILDARRRRASFYFRENAKKLDLGSVTNQSAQERAKRRLNKQAANKGAGGDFKKLHPAAMEWKKARAWLKWINKPQTRGQCKKIFKGSAGWVTSCSYSNAGRLILSAGSDRTFTAWSPQTSGEICRLGFGGWNAVFADTILTPFPSRLCAQRWSRSSATGLVESLW